MIYFSHTLYIPSLSGTFGISTWLALNFKMPKEPSSPSRSNTRIVSQSIQNETKRLKNNNGQRTTRNIRKPGDVGILNFCTFIKNCNGLIGWSFEIPASAYCHRQTV